MRLERKFMLKGSAALIVFSAILWHFVGGAGSMGRSPYGTAVAFTRTLSLERDECAGRMERLFPDVAGARNLCGGAMSEAFRRARRTYIIDAGEHEATAVCVYGST